MQEKTLTAVMAGAAIAAAAVAAIAGTSKKGLRRKAARVINEVERVLNLAHRAMR